jgi:hypothetical protein
MKRTVCFVVTCVLGLTLAISAQAADPQDRGNHAAVWTGTGSGMPDVSAELYNAPNPVTISTVIEYTLDAPGHVRLNIYDSRGNLVEALVDEFQEAGRHSVIWNTADRESGAFVCTLNCGTSLYTRRITVLK